VIKDYSRTVVLRIARALPDAQLRERFESLESLARREFQAEGWGGKIVVERSADLRYRGQGFEINVPFSSALVAEFHRRHHSRYGYSHPEREIELVTLRVRARMKSPRIPSRIFRQGAAEPDVEKRQVWFGKKFVPAAIYDRDALPGGARFRGPAIVTEYSATSVVPPGGVFFIDGVGNLTIEAGKKKA